MHHSESYGEKDRPKAEQFQRQPVHQIQGDWQSWFFILFSGLQAAHCSQKIASILGSTQHLGVTTWGAGFQQTSSDEGDVILSRVFIFYCYTQQIATNLATSNNTVSYHVGLLACHVATGLPSFLET
jgi:hypothetical protein